MDVEQLQRAATAIFDVLQQIRCLGFDELLLALRHAHRTSSTAATAAVPSAVSGRGFAQGDEERREVEFDE